MVNRDRGRMTKLLQSVLLGVLTGLVWMVLGIFACRADVWYFTAKAFGFAGHLDILIWVFGLMFVFGVVFSGVLYVLNPKNLPRAMGGAKGRKWRGRCRLWPAKIHRLWVYVGVSVFSAFAGSVYREYEYVRQMSWIEADGVITAAERRVAVAGGRGVRGYWIVSRYTYSYQVSGVRHFGAFYAKVCHDLDNDRQGMGPTWQVKDTVTVYYDPHDPSDSVKIRAEGAGLNFAWACFLAAMGVGVWWRSRSTLAACKVGLQGEMDCIKETKKS